MRSLSAAALTSLVQGLLLKRELSEDQKERNVNKMFIRGFTADHIYMDSDISLSFDNVSISLTNVATI